MRPERQTRGQDGEGRADIRPAFSLPHPTPDWHQCGKSQGSGDRVPQVTARASPDHLHQNQPATPSGTRQEYLELSGKNFWNSQQAPAQAGGEGVRRLRRHQAGQGTAPPHPGHQSGEGSETVNCSGCRDSRSTRGVSPRLDLFRASTSRLSTSPIRGSDGPSSVRRPSRSSSGFQWPCAPYRRRPE